jgi:hypothetical protein
MSHTNNLELHTHLSRSTLCVPLGLNEADVLKSSSILIYSHQEQSIYAQSEWHDAMLIKRAEY